MKKIHFILMGKGGVGKSLVSSMVAQYLMGKERNPACFDTDPTNATFAAYKAFNAVHINIMAGSMNIDGSKFDDLIERIIGHNDDVVVDCGATSFLPMMAYFHENRIIDFLKKTGAEVVIHAPLVGSDSAEDTLRGLQSILEFLPTNVLVWQNEYYGPVQHGGKVFKESQIYSKFKDRLLGTVRIAQRSQDTFGRDMKLMTTARLTFAEIMLSPEFKTMQRQRLHLVQREIEDQLTAISL